MRLFRRCILLFCLAFATIQTLLIFEGQAAAQISAVPERTTPKSRSEFYKSILAKIDSLQTQIDELKKILPKEETKAESNQTSILENEVSKLYELSSTKPTTPAPSNLVPGLTSVAYTDISCRPKLDVAVPSFVIKKGAEGGYEIVPSDTAGKVSKRRDDCVPLSPLTRLIIENSDFVATGGYSNSVGLSNALLPSNQLITTATTNYSVGIGYAKKPILKQLRALFYGANSREAIAQQGTFLEDFLWNAVTLDASYSWGRQLQVKAAVPVDTFNTRPFYSVSGTYTLDFEKLYIDLKNLGVSPRTVRPADQGWYFEPKDSGYYQDPADANDSDAPNQRFGWPRLEDYKW